MIRNLLQNTAYYIVFIVLILAGFQTARAQEDQSTGRRIVIDGDEFYLHQVDKGQGFYDIARQYNVSQQEILDANPDIEDGLKKDQIIRIPVIEERNTNRDEIESSEDFILHTVEKGQTVWYISRKYDVDAEDIYRNNPGADRQLTTGSIIKVPAQKKVKGEKADEKDQEGRFREHEVKPGDTLFSLSQRYNVSVDDIIQYNPALKTSSLRIGSIVRIPVSDEKKPQDGELAAEDEDQDTSKTSYIEDEDYIYHEIEEGQTLYSIGRRYQVEPEKIEENNPDITKDSLEPGYMLRIPRDVDVDEKETVSADQPDEEDLFELHRVRRKETLFSISRKYDVDMETIREVNSDVDFSNIRRGTRIKIPKDQWFAQRYPGRSESEEEAPTEDSRAKGPVVSSDSICINSEGIGRERPARVALLLPFDLDKTEEANIKEKVEDGDTIRTERKERVIAKKSRVFTEFYEGVLLALDELKKQGIKVDLSVYDIAPNSADVEHVLKSNSELRDVDMIIGPARSDDLKPVADFAAEHDIKVVYPLSNKNSELVKNPNLFQINTPDTLVFGRMTNEIVRQSEGDNLLVVLPEEEDDYANEFLEELRQKVFFNEFALNKDINYQEYRIMGKEDQTNLEALLDSEGKNYVVVPTNKEATISKIVPTLAGISENRKIDISLFGMTEWLRAQSIDPEDMFTLNARIFTFFALDYKSGSTKEFIEKYRDWYYTEPHAISPYFQSSSNSSGYSRYGAWGYDVAGYFIASLAQNGKNFESCPEPVDIQPVQFNFSFSRISNWGGFYNEGLFLLKFDPDNYEVDRVPVFSIQPMSPLGLNNVHDNFEPDIR
ncbi:MAG: LysM peptidoglycan-binding domain-containing protein [Marinilabilia sp.]